MFSWFKSSPTVDGAINQIKDALIVLDETVAAEEKKLLEVNEDIAREDEAHNRTVVAINEDFSAKLNAESTRHDVHKGALTNRANDVTNTITKGKTFIDTIRSVL